MVRILLSLIFAPVYLFVSIIYNFLYDVGFCSTYQPKVFTLVVGNLTWGGTGKTPIVLNLINWLLKRKMRIAVVSRSYKGKVIEPSIVDRAKFSASHWGDEAFLISEKYPAIDVIVCQKKVEGVKWAEKQNKYNIILVDDGLQHRPLAGHFYLTAIDVSRPPSEYHIAPLGTMRETWRGLRRTTSVILTKYNFGNSETVTAITRVIPAQIPTYKMNLNVSQIQNFHGDSEGDFKADDAVLVAGIANPESFFNLVRKFVKHNSLREYAFADHYNYSKTEIEKIESIAKGSPIYTTSKDAVKISRLTTAENWRVVEINSILEEENKFHAQLDEVLRKHSI